jgi:hypothetical protein
MMPYGPPSSSGKIAVTSGGRGDFADRIRKRSVTRRSACGSSAADGRHLAASVTLPAAFGDGRTVTTRARLVAVTGLAIAHRGDSAARARDGKAVVTRVSAIFAAAVRRCGDAS